MEILKFAPKQKSKDPLYIQLYSYILKAIKDGKIENGEKIPSRRELAKVLAISEITVNGAYQKLVSEGIITSRERSGFYVTYKGELNIQYDNISWEDGKKHKYVLSPNSLDYSKIPMAKLSKFLRDSVYDDPTLLDYGDKPGDELFRIAITKHLYSVRGINCSPDQVITSAGIDYLLFCLCRVLNDKGIFGFENPGYTRSYWTIKNSGVQYKMFDIGLSGANIEGIEKIGVNILYLMPNHQYPVGYIMKDQIRHKLLDWLSTDPNRYIIEDDYDGEFTYGDDTPSTLFSMDKSNRVIYIGNFSRCIAPSIRIAYAVIPKDLIATWRKKVQFYNCLVSRFDQHALAKLIDEGQITRLIRKRKRNYQKTRDAAIAAFKNSTLAERIHISGEGGGTHMLVTFDSSLDEMELKTRASQNGIKITTISTYMHRYNPMIPERTFVFGYGGLSEHQVKDVVHILSNIWTD